jgi:hypothetical protein
MSDWPISVLEPLVTIHPWSMECIGPGMITCNNFTLNNAVSLAWPVANKAYFFPFILSKQITAVMMFTLNGATIGNNVDVGVYSADGTRLVSSGSTAQSGSANTIQTYNITDTTMGPGLFYLAMAMDGTTGTVFRQGMSTLQQATMLGCLQQLTAFALPAVATFATITTGSQVPVFGLSTRTVI